MAMDVCSGSSDVEAVLDWTVLCLRPTCGILANVVTPLGVLFPPSLLMGPHRWGGAAVQPPSLPHPAGGKSLPDPVFSLLPESKGGRKTESLLSACTPGIGLAPERGLPSVGICFGSGPTQSLET